MHYNTITLALCYALVRSDHYAHARVINTIPVSSSLVLDSGMANIEARAAGTAALAVPQKAPTSTSDEIDQQFASVSIELNCLNYYFGTPQEPNTFSLMMLEDLAANTGIYPDIRVGGSSADSLVMNPAQSWGIYPAIGPNYFDSLQVLPSNSSITFGLNMLMDNSSATVAIASSALSKVGNQIKSWEIGNEPDLYGWTEAQYMSVFNSMCQTVYSTILQAAGYAAKSFAGPSTATYKGFDFSQELQGLSMTYIQNWSVHQYLISKSGGGNITIDWLTHVATEARSYGAITQAATLKAQGIKLYVGETGTIDGLGTEGISNSMAAAVWTADYLFYLAASGIWRVYTHNQKWAWYSLWYPIQGAAQVRSPYYGYQMVTKALGGLTTPRVNSMGVLGAKGTTGYNIVSYGIYDGDELKSIAIMNMNWFYGVGERPLTQVPLQLTGFPSMPSLVSLEYLSGGTSDTTTGFSWAKKSWDTGSKVAVSPLSWQSDQLNVPVSGIFNVTVAAGEAVLISIGGTPQPTSSDSIQVSVPSSTPSRTTTMAGSPSGTQASQTLSGTVLVISPTTLSASLTSSVVRKPIVPTTISTKARQPLIVISTTSKARQPLVMTTPIVRTTVTTSVTSMMTVSPVATAAPSARVRVALVAI